MIPKRSRKSVAKKQTLLIACEGSRTECHYFNGLRQEQSTRDQFVVTVLPGSGGDAQVVVRNAVRERNKQKQRAEPYDVVWCVLDVEERAAHLKEAVELARAQKILLALSNPSFEVWLIAHFEKTAHPFLHSKAAETHLENTYWRPLFGCEYNKGDTRLYEKVAQRVKTAVENAQWVLENHHQGGKCQECNSATEVYRLVKILRGTI